MKIIVFDVEESLDDIMRDIDDALFKFTIISTWKYMHGMSYNEYKGII